MIQDILPKKYHVEYHTAPPRPEDIVFVFCGSQKRQQRLLLKKQQTGERERLVFPTAADLYEAGAGPEELQYLFAVDEGHFYLLMRFDEEADALKIPGYSYEMIGSLRCCNPQDLCFAGMTAYQLYDWYRINRYCGCCGSRMEPWDRERAVRCPKCGNLVFPKICPAVIIGVKNGEQIVVSRYRGRAYKGIALLAGFCEIGETPEDTVAREVMEEVGIRVKNITYYKSQPWGFDSNLLLGFFCDAEGDTEIHYDHEELAIAEWCSRSQLENSPDNMLSLTARMIDAYRTGEIQ